MLAFKVTGAVSSSFPVTLVSSDSDGVLLDKFINTFRCLGDAAAVATGADFTIAAEAEVGSAPAVGAVSPPAV